MRSIRWLVLPATFTLLACGSSGGGADGAGGAGSGGASSGGAGGSVSSACLEKAADCLVDQKVCVDDGNGPARCEPCPEEQFAGDGLACADIPGTQLTNEFEVLTIEAGEEINSLCQSWTLGNDEDIWVNGVELLNEGAYHHSNWLFVPEDMHDGPDGAWRCSERGYTELAAAVAGGVLFAQSTQSTKEVQKFPEGVAVRLPPRVRVIGGTHLLNTTPDAVTTRLRMNIFSIPASEVEVPLAPFRLSYLDLEIPPQAESHFSGECDFDAAHQNQAGRPFEMDLYWVLPHYHELGSLFRLEVFGGPNAGDVVYEIDGFNSEARGRAFDPPYPMTGATGFRFTCGFTNPRTEEVGWGVGDQEMCVMLGFARSDVMYDGSVLQGDPTGMADGVVQNSGSCGVLGLPAPPTE